MIMTRPTLESSKASATPREIPYQKHCISAPSAMFTVIVPPLQNPCYRPQRSSPLSPRNQNLIPQMPSRPHSTTSKASTSFAQRCLKSNPLHRVQEKKGNTKDKRRDVFFNKVAREREDRKWESRGEALLRMDYLSERRKWEETLRKSAPRYDASEEEDKLMGEDRPDEGENSRGGQFHAVTGLSFAD